MDLVRNGAFAPPLRQRIEQQPSAHTNEQSEIQYMLSTSPPWYALAASCTSDERSIHGLLRAGWMGRLTVSILLPPIQLVIDGQRHALLEPSLRMRHPPAIISNRPTDTPNPART
jgi:hypothetical protein